MRGISRGFRLSFDGLSDEVIFKACTLLGAYSMHTQAMVDDAIKKSRGIIHGNVTENVQLSKLTPREFKQKRKQQKPSTPTQEISPQYVATLVEQIITNNKFPKEAEIIFKGRHLNEIGVITDLLKDTMSKGPLTVDVINKLNDQIKKSKKFLTNFAKDYAIQQRRAHQIKENQAKKAKKASTQKCQFCGVLLGKTWGKIEGKPTCMPCWDRDNEGRQAARNNPIVFEPRIYKAGGGSKMPGGRTYRI